MNKRALITGITGQDGSYLAELLISKGYDVHGIVRRTSTFNTERIDQIYEDPHEAGVPLHLHYGDLADAARLRHLLEKTRPDEVYNLAAQSHVRVSFDQAEYTAHIDATGTQRLLEAFRDYAVASGTKPRFYQAGSSEMFGASKPPQDETTAFYPGSPYAVSKVAAHWYAINMREAYGLFISNGILFNHESPRRGETFVTRKITRALGRIKLGLQKKLYLGNLDSRRDWGHAKDYVRAMWMMLQHSQPDDFVVSTGESYSVADFLDTASKHLELDWRSFVERDERYLRPTEVDYLQGDSSKARKLLGWKPEVSFSELVREMVEHDLEMAKQEQTLKAAGHHVAPRGGAHA